MVYPATSVWRLGKTNVEPDCRQRNTFVVTFFLKQNLLTVDKTFWNITKLSTKGDHKKCKPTLLKIQMKDAGPLSLDQMGVYFDFDIV